MTTYKFSENNSGGGWWLDERKYKALFVAGWKYEPSEYDIKEGYDKNPFPLSGGNKEDTVPYGWRHNLTGEFDSIRSAIESFEMVTGMDFFAEGCNCCGAPFYMFGGDEYLSGNSVKREVIRPWEEE